MRRLPTESKACAFCRQLWSLTLQKHVTCVKTVLRCTDQIILPTANWADHAESFYGFAEREHVRALASYTLS